MGVGGLAGNEVRCRALANHSFCFQLKRRANKIVDREEVALADPEKHKLLR